MTTSMNDLLYRVYDAQDNLIAAVVYAEDAAMLLANMSIRSSVRIGHHWSTRVFEITDDNSAEVCDSIDWTADQITAGHTRLQAEMEARRSLVGG